MLTSTLSNTNFPACHVSIERKFVLPYKFPVTFFKVPFLTVCIKINPFLFPWVTPAPPTFPAPVRVTFSKVNPFTFFGSAANSAALGTDLSLFIYIILAGLSPLPLTLPVVNSGVYALVVGL